MLVHWIWFAHRPGLSDRMKVQLLEHFSDPEDIYFADAASFDHIEGISGEIKESIADKNLTSLIFMPPNYINYHFRRNCIA